MKHIYRLYFILLFLIPFIPHFDRIQILGPQYLFLSILNCFYLVFLLTDKANLISLGKEEKSLFKILFLFLLISFFSFFKAFNIAESIIDLSRLVIVFTSIIISIFISNKIKSISNFLISLIIIFLSIEVIYVFKIFIEVYDFNFPPGRLRDFQGFAYNQNVTAFSIAVKIPILIYLALNKSINKITFLGLLSILSLSSFVLYVIASRGAILAFFVVLFILLFYSIINLFKKKKINYRILSIFIFIGLSIFLHDLLYTNSKEFNLTERVSSVTNSNDSSIDYRLNMYRSAGQLLSENPFLGIGIGNYKIKSIQKLNNYIEGYIVPYHAHNDFIHIFSETGILGGLLYLMFIFFPAYLIIKKLYSTKDLSDENIKLSLFLLLSIGVYILDASLNFPRERLYSQVNFLTLFTIVIVSFSDKGQFIKNFKPSIFGILILSICSIFVSYKVDKSLKEQSPIHIDYNTNFQDLTLSISDIKDTQISFPNLSSTTIPLKFLKAMYYLRYDSLSKAKSLIKTGKNPNPYLGIGDNLLSRIYISEKKYDSAIFYGKRSMEKLPNDTNISFYQMALERVYDKSLDVREESRRVFEVSRKINEETIWANYLITFSLSKLKKGENYTQYERDLVKEGVEKFPSNKLIRLSKKVVLEGREVISIANNFDELAKREFELKNYNNSIDYWKKAIEILPSESSYYFNTIQALLLNENEKQAKNYLKRVKSLNYSDNGRIEFLQASIDLKLGKTSRACNSLQESIKKGFNRSIKLAASIKCF